MKYESFFKFKIEKIGFKIFFILVKNLEKLSKILEFFLKNLEL